MTLALSLLRRFWWAIPIAALTVALLVTRGQVSHWRGLYGQEQANHALTVANVRRATAEAKAADAANITRVTADQERISRETASDYQLKLAALRLRYDGMRVKAEADRGGSGAKAVPSPGATACRVDGGAIDDRLLGFALSADENTVKLIALQDWVRGQAAVEVSGAP